MDSDNNVLDDSNSVDATKNENFDPTDSKYAAKFNIPQTLYDEGWRYSTDYWTTSYHTASQEIKNNQQSVSLVKEDGTNVSYSSEPVSDAWDNYHFKVQLVHGKKNITDQYYSDPEIAAKRDYKVIAELPNGSNKILKEQHFVIIYGNVVEDLVDNNPDTKVTKQKGYDPNEQDNPQENQFGLKVYDETTHKYVDLQNIPNIFSMYGNSYQNWGQQIKSLVSDGKLQGTSRWSSDPLQASEAETIADEMISGTYSSGNYLAEGNKHEAGFLINGNCNELMLGSTSFSIPKVAGYHAEISNGNGLFVNRTINLKNSSYEGTGIVVSANNNTGLPFQSGSSTSLTLKFNRISYEKDDGTNGGYYLAPLSEKDYENYLLNLAGLQSFTTSIGVLTGYKGDGYVPDLSKLPASQTIVIKYVKDDTDVPPTPTTEPVSDSRTITRNINVVDPITGEVSTTKQTVTLTRSGTKDLSTGETTWGDWSTGGWPEFDAPEFKGYTPSQAVVPDQVVTSDTHDVTITITYTKNSSNTDDQGGQKPGHNGSNGGSSSNVHHGKSAGNIGQAAKAAGASQAKTTNKQIAQSLPQTNGENNFAILGWLVASLSALFALAGTSRRKHE
ncbi:MAG: hypothetical protein LKF01_06195 [Lactobacillus sp.]|jgi:hypothetical protein|nr:hypothetical protein [Lactobacillus sp.]MCH3906199.1 hypothetical protein [Lactobacillus sp.]MCH3990223.1 hypothetical protein [Lactobacillus sp.]MCH4069063.1 hypothetical protein [Lactobacillus sp.]MCI1303950.1 hypothetical protein [Lactobacillus sp.]